MEMEKVATCLQTPNCTVKGSCDNDDNDNDNKDDDGDDAHLGGAVGAVGDSKSPILSSPSSPTTSLTWAMLTSATEKDLADQQVPTMTFFIVMITIIFFSQKPVLALQGR